MEATGINRNDVGCRGDASYEERIRVGVETPENIGTMIVIDIETEEYEINKLGAAAARSLQARHPNAILCGKRIGDDVAEAISGVLERTAS